MDNVMHAECYYKVKSLLQVLVALFSKDCRFTKRFIFITGRDKMKVALLVSF